jgi:CheY-like chemotaxis protein
MGSLCGIEPAPKFRNGSAAKTTNLRYGKVLVVDDNVVNQKILTRLLKSVGLRYDIACNGKEAVSFYKKTPGYSVILMGEHSLSIPLHPSPSLSRSLSHSHSLVLISACLRVFSVILSFLCLSFLDTMMPVMDGFQATIKIRAHEATTNRHIPIIAVTGLELLDTKNAKEKCISAGMDDYIPKPVIMKTLKETIFKWLEKGNYRYSPFSFSFFSSFFSSSFLGFCFMLSTT